MAFLVFCAITMLALYIDSGRKGQGKLAERIKHDWRDQVEENLASGNAGIPRGFLKLFERLAKAIMPMHAIDDIKRRLMYAGNPRRITPEEFYSLKLASAAVVFGLTTTLLLISAGTRTFALGIAAGALGYLLPDILLNRLVAKRRKDIERGILSFVDMLALTVDAGLSLNDGINRVCDFYGGELAGEFGRTLKEIQMGRPFSKAFEDLGERNGVDDLRLLTTALIQAEKHGTPIAGVLRDQGKQLRQGRRIRAQEMAQKATVKILIPVVFFMFVPLMVLLLGPAATNLFKALGL
jgi:tight adherence protein C